MTAGFVAAGLVVGFGVVPGLPGGYRFLNTSTGLVSRHGSAAGDRLPIVTGCTVAICTAGDFAGNASCDASGCSGIMISS